eukprot:TRINITY_DN9910_c0_g7_i1.p1 TRINITY_DN9910_c0_g7~~TRINITY_DN9910_c0_g7_i1.p1  ORF type:complete len:1092 (+),score=364.41 TRINITY_DN9910_c0_g7_i1:73-3348(+)
MGSALVKQKQRECDELLEEITELCAKQGSSLCKARRAERVSRVEATFGAVGGDAMVPAPQPQQVSNSGGCASTVLSVNSSLGNLSLTGPPQTPLTLLPIVSPTGVMSRPTTAGSARSLAEEALNKREPPHPRYPGATVYELQAKRDYGREWQEILERPTPSLKDELQKLRRAEEFIREFVSEFAAPAVEGIARDLPAPRRRSTIGSTGRKGVKKSVCISEASDVIELPGTCQVPPLELARPVCGAVSVYALTTEEGAKRARQDCRVAALAAACGTEGATWPLCVYITCQGIGFAVVAEPQLASASFLYGVSHRGRKRLCQRSFSAPSALRRVCESFRLKGTRAADDQRLWGPPEVEIHSGVDGRAYVFAAESLLPHWPPPKGVPVGPASTLWLRPEGVLQSGVPLSCGAFLTHGTLQHRADDEEVRERCRRICREACPAVAADFTTAVSTATAGDGAVELCERLKDLLHARGANCALAGLVLADLERGSEAWRMGLAFCMGRALKAMLSGAMRETGLTAAATSSQRERRRSSMPHPVYARVATRAQEVLSNIVQGAAEHWDAGAGSIRGTLARKFAGFPLGDDPLLSSPAALEAAVPGVLHLALQLACAHCALTLDEPLPPCLVGETGLNTAELQRHNWLVAGLGVRWKRIDLVQTSPIANALLALEQSGDAAEQALRELLSTATEAESCLLRGALGRLLMWDEGGRPSHRNARETERLLKGVVDTRQKMGDSPFEQTIALRDLAGFYSEYRSWKHALECAEKMCGQREQLLGTQCCEYADALLTKGLILQKACKAQEAIETLNQALSVRQAIVGPLSPSLLQTYSGLASLYEDSGQVEEAEPLRAKSLWIRLRTLGRMHLAVSTSLNNLAVNLYHQQRFDEAEPLFRLDIDICERILGPDHEDLATSLNNLANILTQQGRFDKAEPLYRRDIDITTRRLGRTHPLTATSLNNLAAAFADQACHEEALELYRECLQIRKANCAGSEDFSVAETLNNIGALMLQMRDLEGAKEHYMEAISIIEQSEGSESQRLAAVFNNVQAVCEELGQSDEAEVWADRAMDLKRADTTLCRAIRAAKDTSCGNLTSGSGLK